MQQEHEGADAVQVADPAEGEQRDGGEVVHEHLPEVLAPHVPELRQRQRPVERRADHVVPPDITRQPL